MKGFRGPGRCRGDRGIICRARSGGFSERHEQKRSDYQDDDDHEEDLRQGYPHPLFKPSRRPKAGKHWVISMFNPSQGVPRRPSRPKNASHASRIPAGPSAAYRNLPKTSLASQAPRYCCPTIHVRSREMSSRCSRSIYKEARNGGGQEKTGVIEDVRRWITCKFMQNCAKEKLICRAGNYPYPHPLFKPSRRPNLDKH